MTHFATPCVASSPAEEELSLILDNGKMNVITPQIHKDFFHRLREFEIEIGRAHV